MFDCTQLSFLGKFTALGIAVVVTRAKSSVAEAAIAMWHTRLLHPSLSVEATVVVPDAAARHNVAARTVGLVVVTAASMHSLTGELVPLWRLAATGVHGVITPAKAHVATTAIAVWTELFEASPGIPATVMIEEATACEGVSSRQRCHTIS